MTNESSASSAASATADSETLRGLAFAVSLTVKDLAKSIAWYHDVVGFPIQERHERAGKLLPVALTAGTGRILIGQDNGAKGWDRIKGEGFSLQVTTEQSIDAVAKRIQERGGRLESEPADMPWGARVFRVMDPDGYRITISSPRP
jgi:uncharacterized glyoxalase superfamily protein PhnB